MVDVLLIPFRGSKGRVRYRGEAGFFLLCASSDEVVFGCVGSIATRLLLWVCSG